VEPRLSKGSSAFFDDDSVVFVDGSLSTFVALELSTLVSDVFRFFELALLDAVVSAETLPPENSSPGLLPGSMIFRYPFL